MIVVYKTIETGGMIGNECTVCMCMVGLLKRKIGYQLQNTGSLLEVYLFSWLGGSSVTLEYNY